MDRATTIKLLQEIEQNFSVQDWKIKELNIWPIFRIWIGGTISSKELFNLKTNNSKKTVLFNKLTSKISGLKIINIPFKKLKKTDVLFMGSCTHDVIYKNRKYNRFFEPLLENNKLTHTTYIQNGKCKLTYRNFKQQKSVNDYALKIKIKDIIFKRKDTWWHYFISLPNALEIIKILQKELNITSAQFKNAVDKCRVIYEYSKFYSKLIKQTKPKVIIISNFYSVYGLSLVFSARKLNIKTYDMQHGPQLEGNITYAKWYNLPKNGYNVLPDSFWCWDNISTEAINNWSQNCMTHKAILGGNPWIEFWKKELINTIKIKNIILYTLQPLPLEKLFPKSLIKIIKESKYKWIIRFHPTQVEEHKEEIKNHLNAFNLQRKIKLEEGFNEPLPQSITNALVNITNYSGTAIEAASLGVPTILLDSLGQRVFKNLIINKKATYVKNIDNLNNEIEEIIRYNLDIDTSLFSLKTFTKLIN